MTTFTPPSLPDLRLPDQREAGERADAGGVLERRAGREAVPGDARVELAHGHAQLEARQVRAEAPVDAATEGEVAVDLPAEVDAVGIGELGQIGRASCRE